MMPASYGKIGGYGSLIKIYRPNSTSTKFVANHIFQLKANRQHSDISCN